MNIYLIEYYIKEKDLDGNYHRTPAHAFITAYDHTQAKEAIKRAVINGISVGFIQSTLLDQA